MAWFQREVLFIEAESGKVIEETFDYLISSDMAAKKLSYLKTLPLRQVINRKYMKKVNSIIMKFSCEIDEAKETFEKNCMNPPVAGDLPPISGSIFWSQEISQSLQSTLNELESLQEVVEYKTWQEVKEKLDKVLQMLDDYKVNKYTDWSNRVSEILDQNLGRNLIKIKGEENGNNQAFGTITPRANTFRTPISVLKVTTNLHQGAGQDINGEEAGNERRLQSQSQTSVTPGQGENTLEGLFEVAKVYSQSENEN